MEGGVILEEYPGYVIFPNGKIWSNKVSRFMSQASVNGGYKVLNLKNFKTKENDRIQVHRIIAEAFIPNPLNLPTINHIDRDPGNNNIENLEWAC